MTQANRKKSLRVVIVTIADLPEGGGRTSRLRTLAAAFQSLGHQVEIWNEHRLAVGAGRGFDTEGHATQAKGMLGNTPYCYVLGTTRRSKGFRSAKEKINAVRVMCRWLKESAASNPVDVVVINNLSLYDTLPVTLAARRIGARTIQCYEDERIECLSTEKMSFSQRVFGLNSWMADRYCSRMADAMIVISRYLRDKYERLGVKPERLHIVPTIVDCDSWRMPPENLDSVPTILYSGGFSAQEDMDSMVWPLGQLKREGVGFKLVAAGAKPERSEGAKRFVEGAKAEGFAEQIEFLGFLSHAELKKAVEKANLLLNLRKNSLFSVSGLSTKLSECMASGRCVLTTDIGDNGLYLKHGDSALMVPAGPSPEILTDTLRTALTDPKLRTRIGAGGRAAAERHFSLPANTTKLRGILDGIVADSSKGR